MHFFVNEHIGWFHSFAIVNSTAINIGIQVLLLCCLGILWVSAPDWDHGIEIFQFCEKPTHWFPQILDQFIFTPLAIKGSVLSMLSPEFVFLESYCSFNLHFFDDYLA